MNLPAISGNGVNQSLLVQAFRSVGGVEFALYIARYDQAWCYSAIVNTAAPEHRDDEMIGILDHLPFDFSDCAINL
jgi:hypothetical protein